jgi:hypothetical protein
MSDASFSGYTCHGDLVPVRIDQLAGARVVAWWCRCGVWRHASSPHRDAELRAVVAVRMALVFA